MKWESCVCALSINLYEELLNTTRILRGVSFHATSQESAHTAAASC
jgi:hypothetical protein